MALNPGRTYLGIYGGFAGQSVQLTADGAAVELPAAPHAHGHPGTHPRPHGGTGPGGKPAGSLKTQTKPVHRRIELHPIC